MSLPDFPAFTDDSLASIAALCGMAGAPVDRLDQVGIFNAAFAIGDRLILRVPRDHPRFTGATANEAIAVPLARAAGVRTPELVLFDDSRTLLPVPYGVYERVDGVVLERAVIDSANVHQAWQQLGRDLARLHVGVAATPAAQALELFDQKTDPRPLPEVIAAAGYFGVADAHWIHRWLERLAPHALAQLPQRFLHGDSQAANTMVDPADFSYRAVIDWGSCQWGDIAVDFSGVPLRAVPALLAGYRDETPTDDTIEARIVWEHLKIGLHQLRGVPQPERSWSERPLAVLLDVLAFFTETQDPRWRQWKPDLASA